MCPHLWVQYIQNILNMGFDHILTTNYSYELESAALKKFPCASDWAIEQLQDYTPDIKRAEPKYLLHTYNAVSQNEIENQIWHIHGEARKYNSIILGHYYYASLVFKYKELLNRRGYRYAHENITHFYNKSWLDAFILSDVYILGFDFDPSEFDLWWLLNRKKRERVEHGKVFYYSPDHDGDKNNAQRYEDKIGLLKDMEVEICNLGFDFHYFENFTDDRSNHYREFYKKAIEDISRRVEKARR